VERNTEKSSVFKRTLIGVIGSVVLLAGMIAIPYPGPGWLIVFAGLGILATEFDWAKRTLSFGRRKYDSWQTWLARQNYLVKAGFWTLTCVIVVTTIWLLNGYGLINQWLDLGLDWAESPFVR